MLAAAPAAERDRAAQPLDLSTATIADLQAAMEKGALTVRAARRAVPRAHRRLRPSRAEAQQRHHPECAALEQARALDAEREAKGPRGPLHGIVVLAKDVYDTYDMPTSGGFKPMATSQPDHDSFVIDRLRKAGAIILGKLNQSDWYGVAPQAAARSQAR